MGLGGKENKRKGNKRKNMTLWWKQVVGESMDPGQWQASVPMDLYQQQQQDWG